MQGDPDVLYYVDMYAVVAMVQFWCLRVESGNSTLT